LHRRITVLGDYRLGEKLGSGAMGSVYRAWQLSQERPAAVKVLRAHVATNRLFLERFRREAQLLARLNHPNIVRSYGVGKQHGRHYLAMELIEGYSLGDWLYHLG
jgi:serine/threonine-protein kinase